MNKHFFLALCMLASLSASAQKTDGGISQQMLQQMLHIILLLQLVF
jgi:hypothetical protein